MLLRPRESMPATFVIRPMRLPAPTPAGWRRTGRDPDEREQVPRRNPPVATTSSTAMPNNRHNDRAIRCTANFRAHGIGVRNRRKRDEPVERNLGSARTRPNRAVTRKPPPSRTVQWDRNRLRS